MKPFLNRDLIPGDLIFNIMLKWNLSFLENSFHFGLVTSSQGKVVETSEGIKAIWVVEYYLDDPLGTHKIISDPDEEMNHMSSGVIRDGKVILLPIKEELAKVAQEAFV